MANDQRCRAHGNIDDACATWLIEGDALVKRARRGTADQRSGLVMGNRHRDGIARYLKNANYLDFFKKLPDLKENLMSAVQGFNTDDISSELVHPGTKP